MVNVFAIPVFFIVFRETLETAIVVSILLAFLKQQLGPTQDKAVYRKLRKQVWLGTFTGFAICLVVGCGMIGAFYGIGVDNWAQTEKIWEGVFALIASLIISIMGFALLRVSKMQAKWRVKLAKAIEAKDSTSRIAGGRFTVRRIALLGEKYAMFFLPFINMLREGLEAVVFVGGVSLGMPAASIPLATVCGLLAGTAVGFLIYKGGNRMPLQIFLIASTCILYLIAAGLFSRAVWYFEANTWNKATGGDAAENGNGPGSYDIRQSVWHVNCCSPELNGGGGWGIFNALLGWTNSATYGSVISYNLYWLVVIIGFVVMHFKEQKGRLPFTKAKAISTSPVLDRKVSDSDETSNDGFVEEEVVAKADAPQSNTSVSHV